MFSCEWAFDYFVACVIGSVDLDCWFCVLFLDFFAACGLMIVILVYWLVCCCGWSVLDVV